MKKRPQRIQIAVRLDSELLRRLDAAAKKMSRQMSREQVLHAIVEVGLDELEKEITDATAEGLLPEAAPAAKPPRLDGDCECTCHDGLAVPHAKGPCCGPDAMWVCAACGPDEHPDEHSFKRLDSNDCPKCGSADIFLRDDGSWERIAEEELNNHSIGRGWRGDPGD